MNSHPITALVDALEADAEARHARYVQDITDALAQRVGLDPDTYLRLFGKDDLSTVLKARARLRRASNGRRTETIAQTIDRIL